MATKRTAGAGQGSISRFGGQAGSSGGRRQKDQADPLPAKRGFEEAIVSMGKHFDFVTQPKVDYPKGTYLADFLSDKAVDFIKRHKEKPFFLYLPHFAVHAPFEAKAELIARFKDQPPAGGHNNPTYAAMIASVDESVGQVRAALEELKLAENTVVILVASRLLTAMAFCSQMSGNRSRTACWASCLT